MSSNDIKKRLESVGVTVDVDQEEVTINNLRGENSRLKDQIKKDKEREAFLEHELDEAHASLAIERLAVRGLSDRGLGIETGENGLDSNFMRSIFFIYIFYRRFSWFTKFLVWIIVGFFVGMGISGIFDSIF